MLEYYDNKLCIPAMELVERGVMSDCCYRNDSSRGNLEVARRGSRAGCALVVVDSLPERYRAKVRELYPEGEMVRLLGWLRSNYVVDQKAMAYFMSVDECKVELSGEKVQEYVNNASVLNCCMRLYDNAKAIHRTMGEKFDWSMMAGAIEGLRVEFGHTLPGSMLRFRKKVAEYKRVGYGCLVSGKFGNQCARKVDLKTERLILSLAVMENKPWNTHVHEMYLQFVCGELEVCDCESGELFDPDDFTDRNGEPKELSETTICNYLNNPKNKLLVEHKLGSWSSFYHEQMPYMHRHSGEFSLSQVTMDDVDLTRKLKDTKLRVHAYYAYDVVSQCVLGASYGRKKDEMLVVDCFRSMFRLVDRMGWGMPAGIEVENHLMSQYKEGFLQAGVVFPFVRFCAPLNSQEKYAEPMNGAKKRSVIHKNHVGIGRFYGKGKYRVESRKISDGDNDTYEDKCYLSYDQLVADDRADSDEWNHALHPNQKRYKGMTRWDVLVANVNPTLVPLDKLTLSRYIGESVVTSIRRNSTVRVCYEDWWLSDTKVLERLEPNNYKVTACWLPDDDGKAVDVYLLQNGKFIDKVEKVETYCRVMAEQTDEDRRKFVEQRKKVAKFEKFVRENEIERVGVVKAQDMKDMDDMEDMEDMKDMKDMEVGVGDSVGVLVDSRIETGIESGVELGVVEDDIGMDLVTGDDFAAHALEDL